MTTWPASQTRATVQSGAHQSRSACAPGTREPRSSRPRLRAGTAVLALGVGAIGAEIGIVPVLAVLFLAVAAQIVLELAQHDHHGRAAPGGIEIG